MRRWLLTLLLLCIGGQAVSAAALNYSVPLTSTFAGTSSFTLLMQFDTLISVYCESCSYWATTELNSSFTFVHVSGLETELWVISPVFGDLLTLYVDASSPAKSVLIDPEPVLNSLIPMTAPSADIFTVPASTKLVFAFSSPLPFGLYGARCDSGIASPGFLTAYGDFSKSVDTKEENSVCQNSGYFLTSSLTASSKRQALCPAWFLVQPTPSSVRGYVSIWNPTRDADMAVRLQVWSIQGDVNPPLAPGIGAVSTIVNSDVIVLLPDQLPLDGTVSVYIGSKGTILDPPWLLQSDCWVTANSQIFNGTYSQQPNSVRLESLPAGSPILNSLVSVIVSAEGVSWALQPTSTSSAWSYGTFVKSLNAPVIIGLAAALSLSLLYNLFNLIQWRNKRSYVQIE
jgi:hypothetical protein